MDAITQMIMGDLLTGEFNELLLMVVICRLIVVAVAFETIGVIAGHFASLGRS